MNFSVTFRRQGIFFGDFTWLELLGPRGIGLFLISGKLFRLFFNLFFLSSLVLVFFGSIVIL
jgi:hypothetical protein